MIESPKPDDPTIQDADELFRRIPPKHIEADGCPSAKAFQQLELSVNVAHLTTPQKTMEDISGLFNFQDWRIAGFLARVPRAIGLIVYMEPIITNPAHAIVWGRKSEIIQYKLAQACRIVPWKNEEPNISSS